MAFPVYLTPSPTADNTFDAENDTEYGFMNIHDAMHHSDELYIIWNGRVWINTNSTAGPIQTSIDPFEVV